MVAAASKPCRSLFCYSWLNLAQYGHWLQQVMQRYKQAGRFVMLGRLLARMAQDCNQDSWSSFPKRLPLFTSGHPPRVFLKVLRRRWLSSGREEYAYIIISTTFSYCYKTKSDCCSTGLKSSLHFYSLAGYWNESPGTSTAPSVPRSPV